MKILIYTGCGCFNLPPKILAEYLGEGYYFYITDFEALSPSSWAVCLIEPEKINKSDDWYISKNRYENPIEFKDFEYLSNYETVNNRCDPKLIQLFYNHEKELSEDYKVVEIPDDVDWEIVEREFEFGGEYISEKHRIWY